MRQVGGAGDAEVDSESGGASRRHLQHIHGTVKKTTVEKVVGNLFQYSFLTGPHVLHDQPARFGPLTASSQKSRRSLLSTATPHGQ